MKEEKVKKQNKYIEGIKKLSKNKRGRAILFFAFYFVFFFVLISLIRSSYNSNNDDYYNTNNSITFTNFNYIIKKKNKRTYC